MPFTHVPLVYLNSRTHQETWQGEEDRAPKTSEIDNRDLEPADTCANCQVLQRKLDKARRNATKQHDAYSTRLVADSGRATRLQRTRAEEVACAEEEDDQLTAAPPPGTSARRDMAHVSTFSPKDIAELASAEDAGAERQRILAELDAFIRREEPTIRSVAGIPREAWESMACFRDVHAFSTVMWLIVCAETAAYVVWTLTDHAAVAQLRGRWVYVTGGKVSTETFDTDGDAADALDSVHVYAPAAGFVGRVGDPVRWAKNYEDPAPSDLLLLSASRRTAGDNRPSLDL